MSLNDAPTPQQVRCQWAEGTPDFYVTYHDTEWGFPVKDDRRLFEKICLEGFQSGLSWRTILTKRENFRRAFDQFDFEKIAQYDEAKIADLLQDASIVRHQGKIRAVVNNAQCALDLLKTHSSLAAYFWQWEDQDPRDPTLPIPATTPLSVALSKDLKKRGWKFVGPTTVYAFMQAMGLVNDHSLDCFTRPLVQQARAQFIKPQ